MHERHPNVEENRKRIGIVGGAICAGQVIQIYSHRLEIYLDNQKINSKSKNSLKITNWFLRIF